MKHRWLQTAAALGIAAIGLGILAAPEGALAQEDAAAYPSKTVTIIVPFPPGGATDLAARLVADGMARDFGQSAVIENIPGATGAVGTAQASRAAPDGYTLLMGTGTTNTLLPHVRKDLNFDPLNDFEGISLVTVFPNILVTRPTLEAKTTKELVDLLKANPGKYTFASSGYGSSIHLAGELFRLDTGTEMRHVPFTGSAPALTALLGGHVDMMFDNLPTVLPYIRDGKLTALGVSSPERLPDNPDIPTLAETVPGLEIEAWAGLVTPKGTPAGIKEKLAASVAKTLKDPEVIKRMEAVSAPPRSSTPAELDAFAKAGYEKWGRVVRDAKIEPK